MSPMATHIILCSWVLLVCSSVVFADNGGDRSSPPGLTFDNTDIQHSSRRDLQVIVEGFNEFCEDSDNGFFASLICFTFFGILGIVGRLVLCLFIGAFCLPV